MNRLVNLGRRAVNGLRNLLDRLPVDNKLITAGVTYLLTLAVARLGLDLDDTLVPGYLNVGQAIALAAAAAAGYLMPNEASVLRDPEAHDGNPDRSLVAMNFGRDLGESGNTAVEGFAEPGPVGPGEEFPEMTRKRGSER